MPTTDSTNVYVLAIGEIVRVLYGCIGCERLTCDDTTIAADSGGDAVEAIDVILRTHALVPAEVRHARRCQYAP